MNQELIGNVFLVVSAVPATISVIAYDLSTRRHIQPDGRRERWWSSGWGLHLMTYMMAIALVLDLGVIRLVFGETEWFFVLRSAAYLLLVVALYHRMWLLIQAYREGPPVDRPASDLPDRGNTDEDLRP